MNAGKGDASDGEELCLASATAQAKAVAAKEISAAELCKLHLERIGRLDSQLGSYLRVDEDGALAQAALVDKAIASGQELGALAGVPIALKDLFVTKGLETTAASRILEGWVPPYDGTAVAKLRSAGAVVLGKLNMDEFAMGSSTENSSAKPCKNPWDLERVPGGSSGGSAAAVAASLCAASLGTDTGGSIRQPAALTGIVGLKPTYGRVSRYGVIAFASSLDQVGPMAKTVEDAALLLEVIAGLDKRDATSIDAPVPRYRDCLEGGLKGLVIGLPKEYFECEIDPEVAAHIDEAIRLFEREGAVTVPVSLPNTKHALAAYYLIAPAEASSNLARYDGIRYGARDAEQGATLDEVYGQTRANRFGAEVIRRLMLGTFALRSGYYDAYYKKAQQVRTLIARDFDEAFKTVDLVLSPTSPTPAFRIGERSAPLDMYLSDIFTLSCNLAGLPGISVPCGFTMSGLPIGLQLQGRALDEETLLRAAAGYERAAAIGLPRPPLMEAPLG